MFFPTGSTISLLLALSTSPSHVLAAPTSSTTTIRDTRSPRLEDIQCRCLSFSMSAKPTLCTYLGSHNLDWQTAYTFASDHDLKIEFASKATVSKVLAIPKPLPTSILMSIEDEGGEGKYSGGSQQQSQMAGFEEVERNSVSKIVCGLGDEVNHLSIDLTFSEPELHYVGIIVASFMAFLILWVVGEYFWTKYATPSGTIKLTGDEKSLS